MPALLVTPTCLVKGDSPGHDFDVRLVRLLVPLALLFAPSGCRDGARGVPASALELPHGVHITWTQAEPPEGAGAAPQRHFGLAGSVGSEREVLHEITEHLRALGWSPQSCVTTVEECFTHGRYFVALAAASDTPEGFPSRHGPKDQVLAVLEPNG